MNRNLPKETQREKRRRLEGGKERGDDLSEIGLAEVKTSQRGGAQSLGVNWEWGASGPERDVGKTGKKQKITEMKTLRRQKEGS